MTKRKISRNLARLLAGFLLLASPAFAQTGTVSNHAVPIGKGPGVTGFGSALPGTLGWVMTSQGPTTDPAFQALPASPLFATIAQYYAGLSSNTIIAPSIIYPPEVTLPAVSGGTLNIDFSTFIDAVITLNANVTTQNLTNVTAGKDGMITFIQPASGGPYTTVWNTIFKFSGTIPALSTAANAVDVLSFSCRTATFCVVTLLTAVHNP
jgi:hypothetical protein